MDKKDLKNWLSFSKKERNALVVLVFLVGSFFLVPYIFPKKDRTFTPGADTAYATQPTEPADAVRLFTFDPNTVDSAGWKKLGLKDKTVRTIIHYREKGGRFRHPEDIRKIYGLRKEDADRLVPYIRIDTQNEIATNLAPTKPTRPQYTFPIEINKAGAEHWAALPGIPLYLANRIVRYRSAMHGFKNIDQVGSTYGLTAETFSKIKPFLRLTKEENTQGASDASNSNLTEKQTVAGLPDKISSREKININTATEQELLSPKRIPRSVAKAIVIYREQHGPYQQVDDLKKIVFLTEEMYSRIAPYLKVE